MSQPLRDDRPDDGESCHVLGVQALEEGRAMSGHRLPRHRAGRVVAGVAVLVVVAGCGAAQDPEDAATPVPVTVDDARANDAFYECMLDEGIPVTRGADGSVQFMDPDDSMAEDYDAAEEACRGRLVEQGLLDGDTPQTLRHEHDILTSLHECLTEQGFPLVEWVSQEVFVDEGGAFDVLASTAPIDLDDARAACPAQYAKIDAL